MPTPDRKKSKHKKKEKDSTHRSPSKHKSKKKKTSRSPSRNREKKKDYKKQAQSPMNLGGKGITDVFGGLGFDLLKKLQELKDGKKPDDMSNYQFWSYLKPTQQTNENGANDQKVIKDKKNQAKSRLLIPLNYDSLMIILEDPFYQEYLSDEMTRSMRKKLISSIKKSSEQKPELFMKKIHQLEQDLKKSVQVEEPEQPVQLGVIQSIFSVLNNEQDKQLDKEIMELFDPMEVEPVQKEVNEIFEEAKQLFM